MGFEVLDAKCILFLYVLTEDWQTDRQGLVPVSQCPVNHTTALAFHPEELAGTRGPCTQPTHQVGPAPSATTPILSLANAPQKWTGSTAPSHQRSEPTQPKKASLAAAVLLGLGCSPSISDPAAPLPAIWQRRRWRWRSSSRWRGPTPRATRSPRCAAA
jgi:hypothetical protein